METVNTIKEVPEFPSAIATSLIERLTDWGVTLFEAVEGALLPTMLVATTVQVTGVPFVTPVTTMGETVPETLCAPHVAVYPVIGEPPLLTGAVKVTETVLLPAVTVPIVGAPGTVANESVSVALLLPGVGSVATPVTVAVLEREPEAPAEIEHEAV